jgi:RNA polymerase sigma factor (sigma-70 family)
MDVVDEAKRIAQVRAGRAEDFAYLVHRYKRSLFRIVGSLIASSQAEDIVQETFIAAFINICRFDPERGNSCIWLYRIARNLGLNAGKKKREQPLPEGLVIADERTPAEDAQKNEIFRRLDQVNFSWRGLGFLLTV